jgi:hypothetical protein
MNLRMALQHLQICAATLSPMRVSSLRCRIDADGHKFFLKILP